jgi:AraC-like DNA-binding protein
VKSELRRRTIKSGVDRIVRSHGMPRHQHAEAYATVVLEGAYEQLAYAGRLRVGAGDVLVQPTFDCHADRMTSQSVRLIRLPWPRDVSRGGVYRDVKIDAVVKAAQRDVYEAAALLAEALADRTPSDSAFDDWPDLLARDLAEDPDRRITLWALDQGVPRESLTRAFGAAYETTPAQFRLELRAREAWARATDTDAPLAAIAYELGFSDQSHMTRAVKWLTGTTPAAWRVSHRFKTAQPGPHKLV